MYQDKACKKFFNMLRSIDDLQGVDSARDRDELRNEDLVFVDTHGTDYNGRICVVRTADAEKGIFRRVYVEGETVTLCCMTDGEVVGTYPVADIKISGIVTGFFRPLPIEEPVDLSPHQKLFETIKAVDVGRYAMSWDEAKAIDTHNRGSGLMCAWEAFKYGFLKGQRAAKAQEKKKKEEPANA